ncbi:ATP-dependent Clp protease adaptor protein ClpS [Filimonas zeae]|uniref:ATP-dependent Clp protease adaptor protein ClpS n=1 Tax=Filimonas zeae TaxID=1737353 RepID=A0A917IP61_9BACT|nr:ATP-dependent Clp protease adaptor ClpS [Filimonas zeae]MDR6337525.1 ATP-dependent Clp protease adaptor protein ClpS [Filimonas zeae]GGH59028.1 ATP-dependent Clp protease adaptor protein ClpS [Filimonas zeae]
MNTPHIHIYAAVKPEEEHDVDVLTDVQQPWSLIVWNDEVNTFDWVIETLVDVCGHSEEQAEQCALMIHFKGKYAVKNGDYDTLKPMCDAITERGIGATVETVADK